MRRETLHRLGELLYGPGRFGAQLAAGLTDAGPRHVDPSQVTTWLADKPVPVRIPDWVAPQARALALKGQRDLARRAADLAELSMDPEALHASPKKPGRLDRLRGPHPDHLPDTEPTDV